MGSLNSSSLLPPSCDHATPAGRPPPTSNISGGVQFEANLTSHRSGDIDQRIQGKARYPASKEIVHAWLGHSTLAALAGRAASLVRNARLKPRSTIQSAIGVCNPVVRQRSQGFMGGSSTTRASFFTAEAPRRYAASSGSFWPRALCCRLVFWQALSLRAGYCC